MYHSLLYNYTYAHCDLFYIEKHSIVVLTSNATALVFPDIHLDPMDTSKALHVSLIVGVMDVFV